MCLCVYVSMHNIRPRARYILYIPHLFTQSTRLLRNKTIGAIRYAFPPSHLPKSPIQTIPAQRENHHSAKTGAPLCLLQKFARCVHPPPSNHPHLSNNGCESSHDISFNGSSPQIITCPTSSRSPPPVRPRSAQNVRATSVVTVRRRSRREGEAIMSMP